MRRFSSVIWGHGSAIRRHVLATGLIATCLAASPALATVYSVNSEAELRTALATQEDGDVINLGSDITLSGDLPAIQNDIAINGAGYTLDGAGAHRGLFVYSGNVRVENLTIEDAVAKGGDGGNRGGGGAGMGGALFVNSGANVTVSNVTLQSNEANGGNGGQGVTGSDGAYPGGGGGMGGDGGDGPLSGQRAGSGGGGLGGDADGGVANGSDGGPGIVAGAESGGDSDGAGGSSGGGGGGGGDNPDSYAGGAGGGVGGSDAHTGLGGNGGFGGGGGGAGFDFDTNGNLIGREGGAGGFGGGGGGGRSAANGGAGGFGGGGGGSGPFAGFGGAGGFGGGVGGNGNGALNVPNVGGGAAGMGGAIFVVEGGSLTFEGDADIDGNSVTGGAVGASPAVTTAAGGSAFGSGLFMQGAGELTFNPGAGQTQTISDVIADMKGVVDNGYVPPAGTYTGTEIWSLSKEGAGELVLTEENLYSGGTSITGGMVTIRKDEALGSGLVSISNGATLHGDITNSADFSYDIAIDDSGATLGAAEGTSLGIHHLILGDGAPAVLHIGSATMTGRVGVVHATVAAGSSVFLDGGKVNRSAELFTGATGGTTIAAGAILDVLAVPTMTLHQLSGAGRVEDYSVQGDTMLTLNNVTDSEFTGDIFDAGTSVGSGKLSLVKTGDAALTLSGDVTLNSTLTVNAGLLTLSGTDITDAVLVTAGELRVNGSLDSPLTTIAGGGRLSGIGTLGDTVVGGTVAAGNSIGTLTVDGSFDQAGGSTNEVELSALSSDLIHVTGAATIAAATTLNVTNLGGAYVPGARFTVLTADGGLTGEYATLTGDVGQVSAFFSVDDFYDDFNAYLDVVQVRDFAYAAETPNQIATAGALDSLTGGSLVSAVGALLTDAQARAAFDALSGEIHASLKTGLFKDSALLREAAGDRIRAAFDGAAAQATPVLAYGPGGPEMAPGDTDLFALWASAFGSWGQTDGDGNAAAFSNDTGGMLFGADALLSDWRIGLIAGYSHSEFEVPDRASSGDSDNYHLGLYGGTEWGDVAFRSGIAYSWHDLSTSRAVSFPGIDEVLTADYMAGTFQAFGELGYRVDTAAASFEPFANLAYVDVSTDSYAEAGGDAALSGGDESTDTAFTTIGLRASSPFRLGTLDATARATIGWRHAFGDGTPEATQAFAGSDAFTIAGVPIADDSAVVDVGLDVTLNDLAMLGLGYSGQIASEAEDHSITAELTVKF